MYYITYNKHCVL